MVQTFEEKFRKNLMVSEYYNNDNVIKSSSFSNLGLVLNYFLCQEMPHIPDVGILHCGELPHHRMGIKVKVGLIINLIYLMVSTFS